MVSVTEQAQVVSNYLKTELAKCRVVGPLRATSFHSIHISGFGVIPYGSSWKWRLTLDLSSPEGQM